MIERGFHKPYKYKKLQDKISHQKTNSNTYNEKRMKNRIQRSIKMK